MPAQKEQYARWLAALRLSSKGKTIASTAFDLEQQTILSFLAMQTPEKSDGGSKKSHASSEQLVTRTQTGTLSATPTSLSGGSATDGHSQV